MLCSLLHFHSYFPRFYPLIPFPSSSFSHIHFQILHSSFLCFFSYISFPPYLFPFSPHLATLTVTRSNEPPSLPGADKVVLPSAAVVRDVPFMPLHPAVRHVGPPRQVDSCVVLRTHHGLLLLAGLPEEVKL